MKNDTTLKRLMTITTGVFTLLLVLFIVYAIKIDLLTSPDILVTKIKSYGVIGPIIFLFLQIVQVVFPVIPGGASCLAGVLAFGPILGFIYNYLGLVIGSVMAYLLSYNFGLPIVKKLFKKETVNKYLKYIKTNRFERLFFLGILLPGAPDDLLCYIAGISNIKFSRFVFYIIVGKPLTLIFYSLFMKLF